jgi:hypothetical protein
MATNRTAVLPGGATVLILQSGPFRLSRNPLYVGLIALDVAVALLAQSFPRRRRRCEMQGSHPRGRTGIRPPPRRPTQNRHTTQPCRQGCRTPRRTCGESARGPLPGSTSCSNRPYCPLVTDPGATNREGDLTGGRSAAAAGRKRALIAGVSARNVMDRSRRASGSRHSEPESPGSRSTMTSGDDPLGRGPSTGRRPRHLGPCADTSERP